MADDDTNDETDGVVSSPSEASGRLSHHLDPSTDRRGESTRRLLVYQIDMVLQEMTTLQRRIHHLEVWKGAIAGVAGERGALAVLRQEMADMKATMKTEIADLDKRLTATEHVTFKITAAAVLAVFFGSGIVTLVLHWLGK